MNTRDELADVIQDGWVGHGEFDQWVAADAVLAFLGRPMSDAAAALETEIACEVHSASTEGGYLTYEWGGRRFRVDLTLTEEAS